MRWTGRLDQTPPGTPLPAEIANVSLNEFQLSALGAEVTATGDVEVLQPINLPLGEIAVKGSNLTATMEALSKAGLLDEQLRAMGAAMLQVYARPGQGDDNWETSISFGNDGITVNGLPVQ